MPSKPSRSFPDRAGPDFRKQSAKVEWDVDDRQRSSLSAYRHGCRVYFGPSLRISPAIHVSPSAWLARGLYCFNSVKDVVRYARINVLLISRQVVAASRFVAAQWVMRWTTQLDRRTGSTWEDRLSAKSIRRPWIRSDVRRPRVATDLRERIPTRSARLRGVLASIGNRGGLDAKSLAGLMRSIRPSLHCWAPVTCTPPLIGGRM